MTSATRDAPHTVGRRLTDLPVPARIAALPTWLLLGGVAALFFGLRLALALRDPAPWIFHDEIAYSELAKSIAYEGEFAIRDVAGTGGFGVLYPILIAPAFALFDSVPGAYDALRVINCLLVSLTAIPVYLIARRVAGRWLSLAAAGLSLAIPSLMYTGTVMTENAFYPLIAFWALAAVRAFERPTVWRQVAVFAILGLAFLARVQAIVLVPVLATALALVVLLDVLDDEGRLLGRLRRRVLPFWPTLAIFALGAVAVPARQAARGEPLTNLLGAYGGITKLGYDWGAVFEYLQYHLADLDILTGVIPFAAFIAFTLWTLRPSQPRTLRIFSAVGVSLVAWFVVVAAAYGSTPVATRIVERNMFHVVPFLFIALTGWIAHGCPRPWWAVAPAALFAGTMTLALPVNTFMSGTVVHSTPALVPIWRWRDRVFSVETIDEWLFVGAAVGALAFVLVPRRFAPLLLLALALYFVAAARPVEALTHWASRGSFAVGVGNAPPDWIDREGSSDVASFWWAGSNAVPFWESEFFNKDVRRTYSLTGPYDGLVHTYTYLQLRPSGLLVDGNGKTVRERYVLTDGGSRLRGRVVARNPTPDLVVYELDGPLRAVERLEGLFPDRWSGSGFGYRRYACSGGTARFLIENDPAIHPDPFTVTVQSGGEERRLLFRPEQRRYAVTVPLRPADGLCSVDFVSIPTGSAATATAGDVRELGLRFVSVRYSPRR